jgi:hypothetical protein
MAHPSYSEVKIGHPPPRQYITEKGEKALLTKLRKVVSIISFVVQRYIKDASDDSHSTHIGRTIFAVIMILSYRMSENISVKYSLYLPNLLFLKININVLSSLLLNLSSGRSPRIAHKTG